MNREEIYQGFAGGPEIAGRKLAGDAAWAHSRSDGAVAFGAHHFDRANARVQLAGKDSQTDLFAGYQAKFFGWPNLYTPFNSNETENLQTLLYGINHRATFGHGDFVEVAFQTQSGPVRGMAEMLNPVRGAEGTLQPFRFIALGDDDHRTLRMTVESAADRSFLRASAWAPRA